MTATAIILAESLQWFSRRVVMDPLIFDLTGAWEARFIRQGRWFTSKAMPNLRRDGLFEAAKKPPAKAITSAVEKLDDFTDGISVRTFERTVPASFIAGAAQAGRDLGAAIVFDLRSPLVRAYLASNSAEKLGRDVDGTTKDRIRTILTRGYDERWTYARTVKEIRGLFDGFNKRTGTGFTRMSRAEIIANNELGKAYSQGSLRFAGELERSGFEIEKLWAPSASACPELCAPNAAQGWINLNRNFASGHDAPTAHPRCRCSLVTRVKQ